MIYLTNIIDAPKGKHKDADKMRVLLAEDSPISAAAMKVMAKYCLVDMDIAADGLEAIEMVQAAKTIGHPYSLLLIDVMMPIVDGVEATRRLRALGFDAEQLPIIAVTAAASFDEVRTYRANGMQAFLAKPVALEDLKAAFRAWGHMNREEEPMLDPRINSEMLASLKAQFNDRNKHTLKLIETALASDASEAISRDLIIEIRNLLHQIAGTATTFGDASLSRAAQSHEYALIASREDQNALRANLMDAARTFKDRKIQWSGGE